MKTELLHSYSSASLAAIARSESNINLSKNGERATATTPDIVGSGSTVGNVFRQIRSNFCRKKTVNILNYFRIQKPETNSKYTLVGEKVSGFKMASAIQSRKICVRHDCWFDRGSYDSPSRTCVCSFRE